MKNDIFKLQQKIRSYAVKGRWKHSDNFHLTLKFLDEISLNQKDAIDEAMKDICRETKSFTLEATEIGTFGGLKEVRVLWLGLSGDVDRLQQLYNKIDSSLGGLGFQHEKREYKPHITLGQDIEFQSGFDQVKRELGEIRLGQVSAEELILFKSEQVQRKRIYSRISEYDFVYM